MEERIGLVRPLEKEQPAEPIQILVQDHHGSQLG